MDKNIPIIGQRRVKILLGTPMGSTILGETAMFIAATVSRLRDIGAQSGWQKAEGTYVCQNQNALAQVAIDSQADILLLIDSDMSGSVTIAERLMARGKDIVGCDYRMRQRETGNLLAGKKLDGSRATGQETGLEEFKFLATGCLMIRRKVLLAMSYPWFFLTYGEKPNDFIGNDANFCLKARAAGFKIWCDHDLSNELFHNGYMPLARK